MPEYTYKKEKKDFRIYKNDTPVDLLYHTKSRAQQATYRLNTYPALIVGAIDGDDSEHPWNRSKRPKDIAAIKKQIAEDMFNEGYLTIYDME